MIYVEAVSVPGGKGDTPMGSRYKLLWTGRRLIIFRASEASGTPAGEMFLLAGTEACCVVLGQIHG